MNKEKKLSKDGLLGWIDDTLKGWRTTELSHASALVNPSLNKAIKKDIEHLKQIKSLIESSAQAKEEPSEAEVEELAEKKAEEWGYYSPRQKIIVKGFMLQMLKEYRELLRRG